jgi:hypothetical protein
MYLVSHSQPQPPSQSLEFEHEVRREVTLQVMRWFAQVDRDDADERWKIDVEKVVHQKVGLGVPRQYKVGFERIFFPPSKPFLA